MDPYQSGAFCICCFANRNQGNPTYLLNVFLRVSTSGLGTVAVQRPAHTRADSITERTGLTLCSLDERSVTNLPSGSVFLLSVRHSPIAECDTLNGTHTHTRCGGAYIDSSASGPSRPYYSPTRQGSHPRNGHLLCEAVLDGRQCPSVL